MGYFFVPVATIHFYVRLARLCVAIAPPPFLITYLLACFNNPQGNVLQIQISDWQKASKKPAPIPAKTNPYQKVLGCFGCLYQYPSEHMARIFP